MDVVQYIPLFGFVTSRGVLVLCGYVPLRAEKLEMRLHMHAPIGISEAQYSLNVTFKQCMPHKTKLTVGKINIFLKVNVLFTCNMKGIFII